MAGARKQYPQGIVQERRARENGVLIQVVDGEQYGIDGPWSLVCCEHGWTVSCETLANAKRLAPVPTEWCECCAAVKSGKCGECGEKPGPKPSVAYNDKGGRVAGTCDMCHLHYKAPDDKETTDGQP